jgi:UDP-N-acetylglucosamine--N-acetylmuramyl-(pentapeptide) pyrophosphoryl-undecaprenol N-acetylglucosamine transferase
MNLKIKNGSLKQMALRIVIAGGGTGGHLFPGIAIAEEFINVNPETQILFISSGNRLEKSVLSKTNFQYRWITAEGIKGKGLIKKILSAIKIPKGIFESILILKKFSPKLLIGVGSYSSGPVILAARLLRIHVVLCEQNILMGVTNRILSRFADRIYVSFKETKITTCHNKIRVMGNPVRKSLIKKDSSHKAELGYDDSAGKKPFTILVIGGSQGANRINIAVTDAAKAMKHNKEFLFIHQTGIADKAWVKKTYEQNNIPCIVKSFFDDMHQMYNQADIVIARAGATTIAEITALGKCSILVPYPFAADNHQELNARSLANKDATEIIQQKDLSGALLLSRIEYYASHRDAVSSKAASAKKMGKPLAAGDIVNDCYRLMYLEDYYQRENDHVS